MQEQRVRRVLGVRELLARGDLVRRTRRLFLFLALAALVLTLPSALPPTTLPTALALLAATGALSVSWLVVHRAGRSPWWCEAVDLLTITAVVAACAPVDKAIGLLFWGLWFRAMLGSTRAAFLRVAAYAVATGVALLAWPWVPGHTGGPSALPLLASLPLLLLSVAVARRLLSGVQTVSRALQRERILDALGSAVVGEVERDGVVAAGWQAAQALAEATPGLRLALVRAFDGVASVDLYAGPWTGELTAGHLRGRSVEALLSDRAIDAATGTTGRWTWIASPVPVGEAWLLVGGDDLAEEALESAHLLTNQVALALNRCAAHALLVERASLDALTGLPNRSTFRDAVDVVLLEPAGPGCAVLFVDLDDFKYVNDGFGHGAGDDVLRAVAQRLRDCVREGDLCARLGGDEFAVLLRRSTVDGAAEVAERIVEALAEPVHVVTGMAAGQVQVGSSVGVAHSEGVTAGVDEMVQRADVAMYSAKTAGGGVAVFGRRSAAAEAESVLLRELAAATGRGQMEVHYQPVVDLADDPASSSCSGMEALVRWNHPDRGTLGPHDFIARAERTGAIHEIGAHVLDQACRDAAAWTVAGRPLTVHVNVSVAQLSDDRLLTTVRQSLRRSGLPPEQLVVEITESMVLEAPEAVRRVHELAACGVRIAVDDFGTGYASLTALRHLPVSIVKIDRSFVAGAIENPADLAIIEAVVQMADRLGIEIVAEGVEEVEQAQLLATAGAHHAQGFLYSPPLPRGRFDEWLATRRPMVPRPVTQATPKPSSASTRRPAAG